MIALFFSLILQIAQMFVLILLVNFKFGLKPYLLPNVESGLKFVLIEY
ncbi:hypothetical protein SAMN05443633_104252 [Chryseobacterium arachidis]|uniref:Uncharacterized protein n=1 Tax=Chryseobacterium arachidis TaxID=1416778 RepID=A0A1M5BQ68_9FLAO|nr:hypothetical protein SAMN05443633_104252 [Chryseobacterium arachidis]